MKFNPAIACCMLFISMCSCLHAQTTDPVKIARNDNELLANGGVVDEEVADFLVVSADARMMDAKEGSLARQKGSTKAIRDYGKLMEKDQAVMLQQIKTLAKERKIVLPSEISNKKESGRLDLSQQSGAGFDKTFIKMMKIDHQRDIRLFKRATHCTDPGIRNYAKQTLPIIEAHLKQITAIDGQ